MSLLANRLPGVAQPSTARRAARNVAKPQQNGVSTGSKRAVAVRLARPTDAAISSSSAPQEKSAAAKRLQGSAERLNKDLSSSTAAVDPTAPKTSEQLIVAVDQANAELEKQALVKELQDDARSLKRDIMGSTREATPATSSQQLRSAVSKATAQVGPPVPLPPPDSKVSSSSSSSSSTSSKQGSKRQGAESSGSTASKRNDSSAGQEERAGRAVDEAADNVNQAVDEAADSAGEAAEQLARQMNDAVQDASAMAADAAEDAVDQAEDTVNTIVDGVEKNLEQGIDGVANLAQGIANVVDETVAPALGGYSNNSSSSGSSNGNGQRYSWQRPAGAAGAGAESTQDVDEAEVERVKVALLGAVSSLDRGLAANVREARDVDNLARQLERLGGPVTLSWKASRSTPNSSTMDSLSGTWRLIYSSGFNGGSLGGRRPGPQVAFVPTVLGQIYQVIDERSARLDNVVELLLAYGLPRLPFLSQPEPETMPALRLTLRHDYEVTDANTVRIVYEDTSLRLLGPGPLSSLPVLEPPQLPDFLKLPRNVRSAVFGVTYLDDSMRVTRGDRGELRVYLRDEDLERRAPADYVD